jgi:hypothetical protein
VTVRRHVLLAPVVLTGAVTFLVALAGVTVPASRGAHVSVDEPQYLLSATSLGEDLDLDISDELHEERWRTYHRARLPEQTSELDGGRRISPHDPLLPLYLAVPMLLGGWVGAKVALAALAGVLAGLLVWIAPVRFGIDRWWAAVGVAAFTCSPPLAVYATQVYPELPAALVVAVAVAALTATRPVGRHAVVLGACATALPWLSVKYAPVATVLVAIGLWRLWRAGERRVAGWLVAGLAASGVAFAAGHLALYGGLTPYATGDHFVGGELDVVGTTPDHVGRGRRLSGLLLDRHWGLVPWQPAFLLLPYSVGAALRRRSPLLLPLAAGWLTATFVALTAHGYWWPGRQVVAVLPIAVLLVVAVAPRWAMAAALAVGVGTFAWLVLDDAVTWVVHFRDTSLPTFGLLRHLLPDLRPRVGTADEVRYVVGSLVLLGLVALGYARERDRR